MSLDVQTSVDTMPDAEHALFTRSRRVVLTIELGWKTTLKSELDFTARLGHMESSSITIDLTANTIPCRNLFTNVGYGSGMAAQLRGSPARKHGQGFCPAYDKRSRPKTFDTDWADNEAWSQSSFCCTSINDLFRLDRI